MEVEKRLSTVHPITQANLHVDAGCLGFRCACKLGKSGKLAVVDLNNPSSMWCFQRMDMDRLGWNAHPALSLADRLELLPGTSVGQCFERERQTFPGLGFPADLECCACQYGGAHA